MIDRTLWNPRYLAYCAAEGFRDDPEGMLALDKERYIGCMMGFLTWHKTQLRLHSTIHPEAWLRLTGDPPRLVDHVGYDAWLKQKWEPNDAQAAQ